MNIRTHILGQAKGASAKDEHFDHQTTHDVDEVTVEVGEGRIYLRIRKDAPSDTEVLEVTVHNGRVAVLPRASNVVHILPVHP